MKTIINLFFCVLISSCVSSQVTVFETDFQSGIPSNMLIFQNLLRHGYALRIPVIQQIV